MAVSGVVDVRRNPNDPTQRVELNGNGRIDSINGAPVTDGPKWFTRLDQPVARAIHIVDWDEMAGYVLDKQGGFHPFGGAPSLGTKAPDPATHEVVVGVPYVSSGIYVDWAWDPNNPGRGVVLDGFGTLHDFGGAPQAPRGLNRWTQSTIARKLVMQWTPDVRAYTLDYSGGIHHDYAAAAAPGYTRHLTSTHLAGDFPYWVFADMARDLVITDWVGTPAGYTMDKYGVVHAWGGAEPAVGYPRNRGGDWARRLLILNLDDPLRFLIVGHSAQAFEWAASTPPTVVAGGFALQSPPPEVQGTTRPMLAWAYTDPQQDSQAEVTLLAFSEAFASSHTMTDPMAHAANAVINLTITDPDVRGQASPVDLPNGGWRMYVRARDTADQWSPWSSRSWTQNVPLPATPTGLIAALAPSGLTVSLSVQANTTGVADLVRFEYSDDGVTWYSVRTAGAVPLAATTTATDPDIPFGPLRSYRAVAYAFDPAVASQPSQVVTATSGRRTHALTATADASLGGIVRVVEAPSWTREVKAGVFEGLGAKYPKVVTNGQPKSLRSTLVLEADRREEWVKIEKLVESGSTLLWRDPFGELVYCKVVGSWGRDQRKAAPYPDEDTPYRHNHLVRLPLIEVAPPHLAG